MTDKHPWKKDRIPSIWDEDVDPVKLRAMTPEERAKYFPNDYNAKGEPYGDF